ncbi:MAG: nucleoside kinase [Spirochaetota bacterium]
MHTVQVDLPDTTRDVPHDTPLAELCAPYDQDDQDPVVAAIVNNEVLDLSRRVRINATVKPVHLSSEPGVRCYRQSLCFLLALAVQRICPDRRVIIGHSLGDGYFHYFDDESEPSQSELDDLEAEMRRLVAEDLPIERRLISYADASARFTKVGMSETAALLEHRNESRIAIHACGEFQDISHGPLVHRTGVLLHFALTRLEPGFVLRFPPRREPRTMRAYRHSKQLFSIYQEYKEWGKILGITSVGRLNEKTSNRSISEFIRVNEALQEKKIADIATAIADRKDSVRVALIAGPSSSGKTTFTKRLAIQLSAQGLTTHLMSVDDYFVSRELTPRDEAGQYDFESLHAIDVELLNDHLLAIFSGEEVQLPRFDFRTGTRSLTGERIRLGERGILLMEGIHCLNDELTRRIDRSSKYKVYISALTQLNLDDHNRISTTDNRLIRRMVRDYQFRGHSAPATLAMWPSVRRGERKNIFPFQDTADVAFNSALDYELGVLKKHAEPLLARVKPIDETYDEAVRVLSFLSNFTNIPDKLVPDYSIVREFIGDSGFHY